MSDILERKSVPAGTVIMTSGEKHDNAYQIQSGEVRAYVLQDTKQIDVSTHGPTDMIGDTNLLENQPSPLNFETTTETTLIVITRTDLLKKLKASDKLVQSTMNNLLQKLYDLEQAKIQDALDQKSLDDKAYEIVSHLLRDMTGDRRIRYEDILLPHFNVMCRALEDLKKEERHKKQREHLEQTLDGINDDEDDTETAEDTETTNEDKEKD